MADPSYSTTLRNAKLDANSTIIGNAGLLQIWSGVRPAFGGAAGTKLAEFTLASPFAPSSAGGVESPTLPAGTTGLAAGTATWYRVTTSGGTAEMDGDAGASGSGKSMILSTTTVSVGLALSVTSWSITGGNA